MPAPLFPYLRGLRRRRPTMRIGPLAALIYLAAPGMTQDDAGLIGLWTFDEGAGEVVQDLSGHGNTGRLHGAQWVKRGDGYALAFDGVDDWVDCGDAPTLDLTTAVSMEAWVYPETLPPAEPMIFGKYYDSFGLTHYKDGRTWFYISGGGNNVSGGLPIGQWNHVVATFDGTTMSMWVNREKTGSKASKAPQIAHGRNLMMGRLAADPAATDPGYSGTAYWRGRLDDVRLYSRALTETEVLEHYKRSAAGFGVDTQWFDRLRVATYLFRSENRVLATCDYRGVFPLPQGAKLTFALRSPDGRTLQSSEPQAATAAGLAFARLDLPGDGEATYVVRAELRAPEGLALEATAPVQRPSEAPGVPSPDTFTVAKLPATPGPAPYRLTVEPGGGLTLKTGGRTFRVESSYSVPNGGYNRLAAGERDRDGEATWEVSARRVGEEDEVAARGQHYSIARRVRTEPGRIVVRDTIRDETDDDLGLYLDNWVDSGEREFHPTWVAGYPNAVKRKEAESPSTFMAWSDLGIGVVPLDDVMIVHSTVYAQDGKLGVADAEFGLAPRAEYTVEWAIYPCASPDYYDFLNAVRRDLGRTGTVEGMFAFLPRTGVTPEHLALRGVRYGSFGCLTNVADDPQIEIEGIDFLWLPKERARLKAEFDAIRQVDPRLKLMFHIAHSLVSTNRPSELFPDSRVIDAAGNQVIYAYDYDACAYFSRERHEQGWRWYIYYPTPGNSFHDALMKSVDVLIDDIGATGAFMDGFMYGYGSGRTYD
ncbi:MAG: LamG domain-containing protein, partial [Armatimonadetes bacterium]|nr:LamG domain-containing protein [Armatimonadota bacterium]